MTCQSLCPLSQGFLRFCCVSLAKEHIVLETGIQPCPSKSSSTFFKVYNSVHHRTIQINHQPDATIFQFIILTFIYSSTCFGLITAIITARPRTQHDCHHDTKLKPEAATAVIELLMMGGKTPETY